MPPLPHPVLERRPLGPGVRVSLRLDGLLLEECWIGGEVDVPDGVLVPALAARAPELLTGGGLPFLDLVARVVTERGPIGLDEVTALTEGWSPTGEDPALRAANACSALARTHRIERLGPGLYDRP